jgi:MFS transporter, ACS family, solute carrier family 17 (sodium-dependent inorganic phosphate cotransporter), member 5
MSYCTEITNVKQDVTEFGEFDWSEQLQGTILSSFFMGYLCFQLPGGRLAEVIGGRVVYGTALLISSLVSALVPELTRIHYGFLIAIRITQGLFLVR